MNIPFTVEEFKRVLIAYNQAVWPMQMILIAVALLSLVLVRKKNELHSRITSGILGALWIWMGIAYHWMHFTSINRAAWMFGGLFILQGVLFLYDAGFSRTLHYSLKESGSRSLAWIFIAYALLIYPILGTVLGHPYPQLPTFGLPCPTTIFTFGILLTSIRKVSFRYFIIPAIWSLIGFGAALNFGIHEDIGLLVAGVLGVLIITINNRRLKRENSEG